MNASLYQSHLLISHYRALDTVLHDDAISKREAAMNRKQCCQPCPGPSLVLPTATGKLKVFDDYNADALASFSAHAEKCLYCRERNHEAIANAHHASQILAIHKQHMDEEDEVRDRKVAEERRRHKEKKQQRVVEEEEMFRLVEEMDEAHRRAEAEAKQKHDEEVATMEEELRLRRIAADEEADRHHSEIEDSLRSLKEKRNKALAAATSAFEDAARRQELEKLHLEEEEQLEKGKKHHMEQRIKRELDEEEDRKMMRILKQEKEVERRRAAEAAARERRRAALSHHKYLHKHDGVLAASQSGLVYQDKRDNAKAVDDIAHMSLAHANREHLIHQHHSVGGKSFHASHSGAMEEEKKN